jgi:membrane-associated protein
MWRTDRLSITSGYEVSVTLTQILATHGSALIVPLAVIEGPIVAVLAGWFSAQGFFDWRWALFLLVCGDLIGDLVYYWIGRTGRAPLQGLGVRLGFARAASPELQNELRRHATRMLLIGKWTHAVGCVVLIGSGALRLPLPRFMLTNLLATVPKCAVLLGFGYFAAGYLPFLEDHALLGTGLLVSGGVAALALVIWRAAERRAGPMGR